MRGRGPGGHCPKRLSYNEAIQVVTTCVLEEISVTSSRRAAGGGTTALPPGHELGPTIAGPVPGLVVSTPMALPGVPPPASPRNVNALAASVLYLYMRMYDLTEVKPQRELLAQCAEHGSCQWRGRAGQTTLYTAPH